MTGRCEAVISRTASRTIRGWPLVVGLYPGSEAETSSSFGQYHSRRAVQDVLGDVQQHRPGPARSGEQKGLPNGQGYVLGLHHELVVLGDRTGDADGVGLLERVRPDYGPAHLARDGHHRDRVHIGVAQGSHEVGGTRAAGDHDDARPARDLRVTLGHMAGALFVADEYVADGRVEDRVVSRQDGAARQAENDLGVLHLQALY